MRRKNLRFTKGFRVALSTSRAQLAAMVLAPGGAEGDPRNRHKGADQWLYVLQGRGVALVNGRQLTLKPGTLLLIERGDRHEIRNSGRTLLKTLNFYTPRAYSARGAELPAGRAR